MSNLRTGRLLVVVVLAGTFLAGCTSQAQTAATTAPPAPTVNVAPAVGRTLSTSRTFTGQLAAPHRVEIRPRVSGYIKEVAFEDGSVVHEGDLLFRIDPRPFQAEVDRLEAELAQRQAERTLAAKEAVRAKRLHRANAISTAEYDDSVSGLKQAKAAVAATQAQLDAARLDLHYTRITAPITGRVSRAEVREGGLVSPGETLLTTIVSTQRVQAYFHVDQQTYLAYQTAIRDGEGDDQGARVRMGFESADTFPFQGRVDFVDNTFDSGTGTIRVRAVFDNPERRLTPGLFVRLKLIVGDPHDVVLVNDRAVGTDLNHRFVYVLNDHNQVEYRRVKLGQAVGELRVIRSGLQAGETVVVNGLQQVRPGATVSPKQVAMVAPSTLDVRYASGDEAAPADVTATRLSSTAGDQATDAAES